MIGTVAVKKNKSNESIGDKLIPVLQSGSEYGAFIFSHDSRYLLCCCGVVVKVYNTTNGENVHDLVGHTKTVTGLAVNPKNVLQILSCGEEGWLIYWDYLDGVKLQQFNLGVPLYRLLHVDTRNEKVIVVTKPPQSQNTYNIKRFKKVKEKSSSFPKSTDLIMNFLIRPHLVSLGCMDDVIVAASENVLKMISLKSKEKIVKENFDREEITALACHPTSYCIAIGLKTGAILLGYNFLTAGQPIFSKIHWHSVEVLCCGFSTDGSLLLSGGHECVLVRWQMTNTDQRDFKPRMGAFIQQLAISPDGSFYATKHSDNVIQLLDINLSVRHVYRGMTRAIMYDLGSSNTMSLGLLYEPRSRAIITSGLPGHLQFYSLGLKKQLFNLDIVGQNYISPENLDRPKAVTQIRSVAVSEDGVWLATFESWDDGFFTPEYRLKFWMYSTQVETYSLNTTVEFPHNKIIHQMVFRPNKVLAESKTAMLVTVGKDKCFKVWTLVDDSDIYRSNDRWNCESVGFYRDMDCSFSDFSQDGSTLAVSFEHLVTLWDPENNILRATLLTGFASKELVRCVRFGSNESCHQLVALTSNHLVVWDLLTLTVKWSKDMRSSFLICDPISDLMASFPDDKSLLVFRPSSPESVFSHVSVSTYPVLSAVFVPDGRQVEQADVGWPGSSQIFFYNSQNQLLALETIHSEKSSKKVHISQNLPKSVVSMMMAEKRVREQAAPLPKETVRVVKDLEENFLSSLLSSNEPVSLSCDKYLSSLLVKRKGPSFKRPVDESDSDTDSEQEDIREKFETPDTETERQPVSGVSSETESDMNELLSKSDDWVRLCAALTIK